MDLSIIFISDRNFVDVIIMLPLVLYPGIADRISSSFEGAGLRDDIREK